MANFNGGPDGDIFTGGSDNDAGDGAAGNDTLNGNGGNDSLAGDGGADTLDGGDGEDVLYSGTRTPPFNLPYYDNPYTPPLLDRGTEVDTLRGGAGSDALFAGYGDNVDGGANGTYGGDDYLYISFQGASSGVVADFRLTTQTIGGGVITGIESLSWVEGSNYNDDINVGTTSSSGYADFTAVFGMGGNDHLAAGYYTGRMDGGDGNDVVDGRGSQYLQGVYGGAGDDTLYTHTNTFAVADGGSGNDTIYAHGEIHGGTGNDTIIVQWSYYAEGVYGEEGDDDITASSAGHFIAGGAGADTIRGDSGDDHLGSADFVPGSYYVYNTLDLDFGLDHDVLTGGGGNDELSGGYGDSLDGGEGSDTLRYSLAGMTAGVSFSTARIAAGQPYSFGGGTIQNIETFAYLRGTDFADNLVIATQSSLLTVDAGAGNDIVTSNASSVSLAGGLGNDLFISGIAGDTFDGGEGTDTVDYRNAASAVTVTLADAGASGTGAGGDSLVNVENVTGSAGNDILTGNGVVNILSGGVGNDQLDGGGAADLLVGGVGDDRYYVDSAGDMVREAAGEGRDTIYASASYTLRDGVEVELLAARAAGGTEALTLTGNSLANSITGNAGHNTLVGGGGADALAGLSGNDLLDGGAGVDIMEGGGGDDRYYVDSLGDVVRELSGQGQDTIYAPMSYGLKEGSYVENLSARNTAGIEALTLAGNSLANTVTGNAGGNALYGNSGNDSLIGLAGNDLLDGGAGGDILNGGLGDDRYYVDAVNDVIRESAGEGNDGVYSAVSYTLSGSAAIELLGTRNAAGTEALDLTGNGFDNAISGNAGNNRLEGGGGTDRLTGMDGADVIDGGSGRDYLSGGAGADTYRFTAFSHSIGAAADTILDFTSGSDRIDLAAIDANTGTAGDDAFAWIGANAFTGVAGQLRTQVIGSQTWVYGDVNGDAVADLAIAVNAATVQMGDFVF